MFFSERQTPLHPALETECGRPLAPVTDSHRSFQPLDSASPAEFPPSYSIHLDLIAHTTQFDYHQSLPYLLGYLYEAHPNGAMSVKVPNHLKK